MIPIINGNQIVSKKELMHTKEIVKTIKNKDVSLGEIIRITDTIRLYVVKKNWFKVGFRIEKLIHGNWWYKV